MKRILIISIALIYFKASLYAASTSGIKVNSYPDPENMGGEEYKNPVRGSVLEQSPNQISGNLTKQYTNQTSGNVTEHCTNHTAAFEQIVNLTKCSVPRVPQNGGLVCVYFDSIYYCKPMCNQGYDFAFLRRSRLFEECGNKTAFTWTTQYIGGSRLAECIASDVVVSGQPSAYFIQQKCPEVVSNKKRKQEYIDEFIQELDKRGIRSHHKKELDLVACENY